MSNSNKPSKILCFDLESNGLHGEAFAIGAVVIDAEGTVTDEFIGRTEIVGSVDEWVSENVLPVMTDMQVTHSSYKHLRDNFWSWFVKAQKKADFVLVSNGYPVEYRFLIKCQDDNIQERYWQHPFPLLDLTSILVAAGHDSVGKGKIMKKIADDLQLSKHHPVHDAKITALAAFEVLDHKNN